MLDGRHTARSAVVSAAARLDPANSANPRCATAARSEQRQGRRQTAFRHRPRSTTDERKPERAHDHRHGLVFHTGRSATT